MCYPVRYVKDHKICTVKQENLVEEKLMNLTNETTVPSYKLLCKKHNMLTFSGCMQARLEFLMCPVQLRTLSEGALVAGTQKYLAAKVNKSLYQ